MSNLISLPMYDLHHANTLALLQILARLLAEEGFTEYALLTTAPQDYLSHWRDPKLLLSQTCGYPLCTLLSEVQLVGTFHYQAAGCKNFCYSSQLVVRATDAAKSLSDFRQQRVVCNSTNSQSGYHSLRELVASLHHDGRFFSEVMFSGSHLQSLADLKTNKADIAAIDAVSWALARRHQPELTAGLAVIGTTPLRPGLPMITSPLTTPEQLCRLRNVLTRLVREPAWRHIREAQLINDFTATERKDYQPIYLAAQRAAASGLVGL